MREIMWKIYSPMCREKFMNGVVVKMHYVNFVVKTDDSVPDASEKICELGNCRVSPFRAMMSESDLSFGSKISFVIPVSNTKRLHVDMCLFLVMLLGFL